MDELLETVTETEKIHDQFRVWITTEVHAHFPISLLQVSIKSSFSCFCFLKFIELTCYF